MLLLIFLSGAICALPLLFPQLFFLSWIAVVPFICVMIRKCESGMTRRRSYLVGFVWFGGYFFSIYHWFCYLYPMEFLGFEPPMAVLTIIVCWLGLTALQAIQMAFVALAFRLLYRGRRLLAPLIFASVWLLFEWAQTLTWAGMPWARLSLSQTNIAENIQSASVFGSLGLSFIIVLANGFIALAILTLLEKKPKLRALPLIVAALVIYSANAVYGSIRINEIEAEEASSEPIRVALIQGNISSTEKWKSGMTDYALKLYLDMTYQAKEEYSPDIVLWPESVIPTSILRRNSIKQAIRSTASETGCIILAGAFDTGENGETYNALIAFYPDGSISEKQYYKRHLVPFGEYMPMKGIIDRVLPMLADLGNLGGDLSAGKDTALFNTEFGKIGGLICFDSIYETLTIDSVRDGAGLIALATNDSWYGNSAAIYQHNAHAKLRAVENGRYVARAANTGVSSFIDAAGRSFGELKALETGNLYGNVKFLEGETVYNYIGNLPVYIVFVFCIILFFSERLASLIIARQKQIEKTKL